MPHPAGRKKPTDLDGARWLRYSISVWNDIRKTKVETAINHPALFPTQLIRRFLKVYVKRGDTVLDPFLGSGSTLVAAKSLGIHGVGFEITPEFVNLAKHRLAQSQMPLSMQETKKKLDHRRIFLRKYH